MKQMELYGKVTDSLFEPLDAVAAPKDSFMSTTVSVLLKQSVPEVAPPGGAFFHMVYDSSTGPIIVDCYLQKSTMAIIPSQTTVLFDHTNLPHTEQQLSWDLQPGSELTELEFDQRDLNMCVYSIPHSIKYYVRNLWLEDTPDTDRIERLCSRFGVASPIFDLESFERPEVKLKYIRDFVDCLDSLVPHARACGVDVPKEAIPSIRRFLAVFEAFVDAR